MSEKSEDKKIAMTLVPGKAAVEAADDPEKLDALCEDICAALGIEPDPGRRSP
ncbi:MAG: hypothetical protein JXA87_16035 [Thermoleophilia bacterium]|nr:hypothetical protein [Thermoleophilia bacterium]